MKAAALIFPHQLFNHHPAISKKREIFLVEERLFFSGVQSSLKFHKKKLVLHRASMQAYKKRLESQGYHVQYIEFENDLFQTLIKNKIEEIWFSDPVDRLLESKLNKRGKEMGGKNQSITHFCFFGSRGLAFKVFQRHPPFLHGPLHCLICVQQVGRPCKHIAKISSGAPSR